MAEKRVYTTKQVIVPAKYFLKLIAEDAAVKYPVTVSVFSKRDCGSYYLDSPDKIRNLLNSKSVYECRIMRVCRIQNYFYVDIWKGDQGLTIERSVLPYCGHMSTLKSDDVKRLYQEKFSV